MHKLLEQFGGKVNFLTVYIVEAHAIDEWPVGDPLKITQPLSLPERVGVAREFVREYDYKIPLLVDQMDNNFSEQYAAWPIRFYVLEGKKLVFKAQPDHNNTYDSIPPMLHKFLARY